MRASLSFVARYLHIVVIVLTSLAFGLTVVGCSSGAVRVASADATSFQHKRDVDIASRGRWPAHEMRKWVRGESSDKVGVMDGNMLPEPYIDDNAVLGKWPSQFHLAYAAVVILREHYAATHPAYQVPDDVRLVAAVEAADGSPHEVLEFEREREIDIVDVNTRQLFEVVPRGRNHLAGANNKVDWILQVMNKAMGGASEFTLGTGYAGAVGVRFAEKGRPWQLSWQTKAPGVIAYQWHVLGAVNDKGENEDEDDEEAYRANHWHEPTTHEMTSFGRALHETVERLAYAREKLGPLRAATEMPILLSNTAPDYRRSVSLWGASGDTRAQLLPIVRADAPEVVRVPESVAKRLASCTSQSTGRVKPAQHTMSFNVHVTNKGKAVSAYIKESTLGERNIEACMVAVLRQTSWLGKVEPVATVHPAPVSRAFFAQPAPALTPPDSGPVSGTYPKGTYPQQAPQGDPRGLFKPLTFTATFGPLIAGVVVFGAITFLSSDTAPAWMSELNPITGRQYKSEPEYEAVRRLTPAEIQAAQRAHIKATQSQPPPAPAPPPAPITPAQREQEKKAQQCAKVAAKIYEILYAERKAPPNGGFPQGRKGIAERWREFAENRGNWGRMPDGSLERKPQNHLAEYEKGQRELNQELEKWKGCDPKDLPRLAHEYATQKPELGPGKPLEPKPNPPGSAPVSPIGNVPKDRKRSE